MKARKIALIITPIALVVIVLVVLIVGFTGRGGDDVNEQEGASPIVQSPAGTFKGVRATDGDYSMYLGIPYGRLNETNPFGLATLHPPADGIYDAVSDSTICIQREEFNATLVGVKDCLTINLYIPDSASPTNKLPVLFYIYGGSFRIGFAGDFKYGPKYLVRHDIILVTFNYRLGPYGFMCLNTPEVSGNQGLKDQILALQWVQQNIESFGGDPNQVTLCGNSAGATSADLLVHYAPENLFSGAIMQSGNTLMPNVFGVADPEVPLRLAEVFGFYTNSISEAIDFLAQLEPEVILEASEEIGQVYSPCLELTFPNVDTLITELPTDKDIPNVRNIAVLLGFNNYESRIVNFFVDPETYNETEFFYQSLSSRFNLKNDTLFVLEKGLRHFYIGDEQATFDLKDTIADFRGDVAFQFPLSQTVDTILKNGAQIIYHYVFSYAGGRNYAQNLGNFQSDGALHADEIGYLFDMRFLTAPITDEDQLIIDRMTTLWANFVKYRDPTPATTELLPIKWERVTNDSRPYLEINTNMESGRRYANRRMVMMELVNDIATSM